MPKKTLAWVVVCLLAALTAQQQLLAARHVGRVTLGPRGVPGATVTATQGDRRIIVTTDGQGHYQFPDLPDGTWTIAVEMRGFAPLTREIVVAPDTPPATWELRMLPVAEVTAGTVAPPPLPPPAPVPTAAATRGTPAPTAGAAAARPAAPGASGGASPAPAPRPAATAAGGAQPPPPPDEPRPVDPSTGAADGFVIAGSVSNAASSPFAQSARFGNFVTANFGRRRYFTTVTLSGNSSSLNATPYSLANQRSKPDYNAINATVQLSGPLVIPGLVRNGPNFTLSFQRNASDNVSSVFGRMPTERERLGDFSQTAGISLVDPETGGPFEGNQLPPGRISPEAAALLAYYPLPNGDPNAGINFQLPQIRAQRGNGFTFSTGRAIRSVNQVTGTVTYNRSTSNSTSLFGFADDNESSNLGLTGNWTRRLSTFMSVRVTHTFSRQRSEVTPHFANVTNVSGNAGLTGNDQDPRNWGPPTLVFSGDVATLRDASYSSSRTMSNQTAAETNWTRGRHNFTFGGQVRRNQLDVVAQDNSRGTFFFSGQGSGSPFADFLLGMPQSSSLAFGSADQGFRAWSGAAYVVDDLRLRSYLTLNLGLRWEYEAPVDELLDRLVNLDVAPGFTAVSPVLANGAIGALTGRRYPDSLVRRDILGFQPRLSLAWRPILGSSLLVRAGYDRTRSSGVASTIARLMAQQPPLATTGNAVSEPGNPLHLADGFTASPDVTQNTFAIDPDFRVAYAQNWQVYVQRDMPMSLTMAASYLGTHGGRLVQQFLPNTYAPGATNPCPTCPSGFRYVTSHGSSTRNAARFEVRRRTRNGLTASAQYTLAKATDNSSGFGDVGASTANTAQNWLDLDAERGPSSFDQRHLFGAQATYNTGVGLRGGAFLSGWRGKIIRNWTIDVRMTTGSGLPVTPLYQPATTLSPPVRAALTGESTDAITGGYYLNPAAYGAPAPGSFGNVGRNSGRGPRTFTLDGSLQRGFPINPRVNLDFRLDATNLLNRVVYTSIENLINSPQFGLPGQVGSMRTINARMSLRF